MNLGQLHARIARAIGKGTSLDSSIPDFVEEAVQWMEANYNFQYMKRWLEFEIDPDQEFPHKLSIYNTPIKKIEAIRIVRADPSHLQPLERRFRDLRRIDPKDRQTRFAEAPSAYWLNGVQEIILDAIPQEASVVEAHMVLFSSWQSAQNNFQHYLIDRHRSALIARTCMLAAIDRRDPRMFEMYQKMYMDVQTTINVTEEDIQYGSGDQYMSWSPETEFNTELDQLLIQPSPSP